MVWIGWIIAIALMTVLAYICWSHAVILQPGKADAIIIVLGYVSKNGRINPLLKERLDEAYKRFQQYGHKYIIVSGSCWFTSLGGRTDEEVSG